MPDPLASGPALDREEAERLAALCRDLGWGYLAALLKRRRSLGLQHLLRRTNIPAEDQFWKGFLSAIDEILELPSRLGKQIFPKEIHHDDET